MRDLTGLESATNLTELAISGNVSDISLLADLTQLNHLELFNTITLSDLSPLAGLTQLNHLRLSSRTYIGSVPFGGFDSVELPKSLYNCYNVSDLSPLAGLTQLNQPGPF